MERVISQIKDALLDLHDDFEMLPPETQALIPLYELMLVMAEEMQELRANEGKG